MAESPKVRNTRILFDAVVREHKALVERLRKPDESNWFKSIDGPPGRGIWFTGDDGWDALWALVDECLKVGKIELRADRQAMKKPLADILVRKFITEGLETNEKNVAQALSEASRAARANFRGETHYIPVQLSSSSAEAGLAMGAVRFLSRKEAKSVLRSGLASERKNLRRDKKIGRQMMLDAIQHLKKVQWFIEVPVGKAATERSKEIAQAAASSALDLLQLIIGARNSRRMTIIRHPGFYERTASIVRNDDTGALNVSTGWNLLGEGLPDDWTAQVLEGEGAAGFDRAGIILQSRLNPEYKRPLSDRVLDAAQWFGEAVRDTSASTRLVKYISALERLTLTKKEKTEGEPNRIAEVVSDRVAALTHNLLNYDSFDMNKATFKRIYNIRSSLVHGSISPRDPKVVKALTGANDFTEASIMRLLHNAHPTAFEDSEFGADILEDWYNRLVIWVKAGGEEGLVEEANNSVQSNGPA